LNILVYCSKGYFVSQNCMRELIATTTKRKPAIALVDPDTSRGGLSIEEVQGRLHVGEKNYPKWGLDVATTPDAQVLFGHLFSNEPIEWNRIGVFQDITLRLIAERVLVPDAPGTTYVDGELISIKLKPLPPPRDRHDYHVYCSCQNPGAAALMQELAVARGFKFQQGVTKRADERPSKVEVLLANVDTNRMAECDHMVLYLTSETWTRGHASEALADDVRRAMDLNVHVLLAHEMPGDGGQEARHACEFGEFFSCEDGATPGDLLKRGIYDEIAIALKGGPWREASMAMLGMALGLSKEEASQAMSDEDLLVSVGLRSEWARKVLRQAGYELSNRSARLRKRAGRLRRPPSPAPSDRPSMSSSVGVVAVDVGGDELVRTKSKTPSV